MHELRDKTFVSRTTDKKAISTLVSFASQPAPQIAYWKKMLAHASMPTAISDLISDCILPQHKNDCQLHQSISQHHFHSKKDCLLHPIHLTVQLTRMFRTFEIFVQQLLSISGVVCCSFLLLY